MITKYHKEIGFERNALDEIQDRLKELKTLTYTHHAKLETIKDRYQTIPVLKLSDIRLSDIFEYTKENGQIFKVAIRVRHLSNKFDFSYSVTLDGRVLTTWANTKEDSHRTLNHSLYEKVN